MLLALSGEIHQAARSTHKGIHRETTETSFSLEERLCYFPTVRMVNKPLKVTALMFQRLQGQPQSFLDLQHRHPWGPYFRFSHAVSLTDKTREDLVGASKSLWQKTEPAMACSKRLGHVHCSLYGCLASLLSTVEPTHAGQTCGLFSSERLCLQLLHTACERRYIWYQGEMDLVNRLAQMKVVPPESSALFMYVCSWTFWILYAHLFFSAREKNHNAASYTRGLSVDNIWPGSLLFRECRLKIPTKILRAPLA